MPIAILVLIFLLTLGQCPAIQMPLPTPAPAPAPAPPRKEGVMGKIIAIKDGDTVVLLQDTTKVTVRLEHIDSPEKAQPYGNRAKQYLGDLCFGQQVTIVGKGRKDRNGRLVGEVYNQQQVNCNLAMVEAGWAWHFKKYSTNSLYAVSELIAKEKKKGLWADPQPCPPWDWRERICPQQTPR